MCIRDRLWDWHALQDTLRQIQEIRTYYDFPDIDIDRYEICLLYTSRCV